MVYEVAQMPGVMTSVYPIVGDGEQLSVAVAIPPVLAGKVDSSHDMVVLSGHVISGAASSFSMVPVPESVEPPPKKVTSLPALLREFKST
jgi:hypothetical protein